MKGNLPFDGAVIKHAQFLHSEKWNFPGSLSAISSLLLKVTTILMTCLSMFEFSSPTSCESIYHLIKHQWHQYQ